MSRIDQVPWDLPPDLAASIESAIRSGEYESAEAIILEALRDWSLERAAAARGSISIDAMPSIAEPMTEP